MEYLLNRYNQAAQILPPRLKTAAEKLSDTEKTQAEEFRLRINRKFSVILPEGEKQTGQTVTREDIQNVLDIATNSSIHTAIDSICHGFITAQGGHRIGICGTAALKNGEISNFREISSLALRISKEIKGIAEETAGKLITNGEFNSTLIISPPGMGKTTLLRDLIRLLGEKFRVSVSDERGEIAACFGGVPQLDIGRCTDIMENCPKSDAMMMLLRCMSPQIIAADEITAPEDLHAMEQAAYCGVKLLATAHAGSPEDLSNRMLYKSMLNMEIFTKLVIIHKKTGENGKREFSVTDLR